MSCLGIFYKCFPSHFTVTAFRVTERICAWKETSCTSHWNVTRSPVMALRGFSFLSFRIPSGKSFKPMLHSAGNLREAGNQIFTYNYCIKWNHQEVIRFLATSLLTMMQPMNNLGKRRIWVFCCSICHDLGWSSPGHVSSTAWSAKMFWQPQRGSAHPLGTGRAWGRHSRGFLQALHLDFMGKCCPGAATRTWLVELAEFWQNSPKIHRGCAGVGCFPSCCQGISFQLGKIY